MNVYIYSPQDTLYEGDAEVISLPTEEGEISVLENHIPLISTLGAGNIKIRKGSDFDEEKHSFSITGGFVQINPHDAIFLVNSADSQPQ